MTETDNSNQNSSCVGILTWLFMLWKVIWCSCTVWSWKLFQFIVQFQGDPTYLVVEKDRTLAPYGINAVCTHLGCVVPWNAAENKFICPCHGSQYNNQGKVVRGPAPLVSKTRIHPFLFEYDLTKNAFIGPGMNSALEVVLEEK